MTYPPNMDESRVGVWAQMLVLADELLPRVSSGVKRGTVRTGIRDINLGNLLLIAASGNGQAVAVWVERVSFTTAGCLTDQDALNDGYADRVELIDALLGFYPNLMAADPVTVISFTAKGASK